MKKVFSLALFVGILVLSTNGVAQEKIKAENLAKEIPTSHEKPSTLETKPPYIPMYVVSDKELPSYFLSGEVPVDFPKYDGNKTKQENVVIALKWCNEPDNYALLTDAGKQKVDDKTKELQAKQNRR